MTIAVGAQLPQVDLFKLGEEGPEAHSVSELFKGKKCVLLAVPGAFTPTCHQNHVPGFLEAHDQLKAKGIDEIFCVAVNDPFVVSAWASALGVGDKITMLSDGNGAFTKALGLELDGSGFGLGIRSHRYAMLVEDGVVKVLNLEEDPTQADVSSAEKLLGSL